MKFLVAMLAAVAIATPALAASKKVSVASYKVTWESIDFSRPSYRTDPDPFIRWSLNKCGPTVPSCVGGDNAGN